MTNQFNVKLLSWLIPAVLLLNSCANTVTSKDIAEVEITFELSFESTPNAINSNYYIIYGNSTNININYLVAGHYFFIPGETYEAADGDKVTNDGINYFYDNFFESWAGILSLKSEDLSVTKGPFSSSSESNETDRIDDHYNYTSENLSLNNYNISNGKITFTIAASALDLSTNSLFFTIVTTTGNEENNINDLVSDIQEIKVISNTPPVTSTHDTSSFFQEVSAAKILSWTITVQ